MSILLFPSDLADHYCGPLVPADEKLSRITTKFSQNKTCSYVPLELLEKVENFRRVDVEKIMRRPICKVDLIESLTTEICDQFETRCQIFLLQLVFLHNTKLELSPCYSADAQHGGSGSYTLVAPDAQNKKACESAHPATISCFRIKTSNPEFDIAFGQGSSFHIMANTTTWLPIDLNKLDTTFDNDNYLENSFRHKCFKILSCCAQGSLDPHEGLIAFLDGAFAILEIIKEKTVINPSPSSDIRIKIANLYQSVIDLYYFRTDAEIGFTQEMCGLHNYAAIDDNDVFRQAQYEMHQNFVVEMEALRKLQAPLPTQRKIIQSPSFSLEVGRISAILRKSLSEIDLKSTSLKHVEACLVNNIGKNTIQYYLILSPDAKLDKEINILKDMSTNDASKLTGSIKKIYEEIYDFLNPGGVRTVYKVNQIACVVISKYAK